MYHSNRTARILATLCTSGILLTSGVLLLSGEKAQAQNCTMSLTNNVGDNITVTASLSTTDVNENGEGEPLLVSSTGGALNGVISAYFVPQTFTYTATQANETIIGTIVGNDGDESCSLAATVNRPGWLTQSQKNFFSSSAAGLALPAGGFWTVAEACTLSIIAGPICTLPSGLLAAGFATTSALSALIALDPPDPNFTQIAVPVIPTIPAVGLQPGISKDVIDTFNQLLANQAQVVGTQQALYSTLNRASGAFNAGNTYWLTQQQRAATQFQGQLSKLFSQQASLLAKFQVALTASGIDVNITRSQVLNFESQVAFSGFSTQNTAYLQQFGADASLINTVRNLTIVQDVNVVSGNLTHLLTSPSLISTLTSLTVGPPTDKDECKGSGWQAYNTPHSFKNQGDCIQFVNTGK